MHVQTATPDLTLIPAHSVLSVAIGPHTRAVARAFGRTERTVYLWRDGSVSTFLDDAVRLREVLEDAGQDPTLARLPGVWTAAQYRLDATPAEPWECHPTHLHALADGAQAAGTYQAVVALALHDDIVTDAEWRVAVEAYLSDQRAKLAGLARLRACRVRRA